MSSTRVPRTSSGLLTLAVLLVALLATAGSPFTTDGSSASDAADAPFDGAFRHSMPPEARNALNAAIMRVPLDVPGQPSAIAVVEDAVWVATLDDSGTDSHLTRVPLDEWYPTGTVTAPGWTLHHAAPIPFDGEIHALVVARDSLWAVVTTPPSAQVLRLDPATGAILQLVYLDATAGDVLVGDGAIWVAASHRWRIWRINTTSGELATFDVDGPSDGITHLRGALAKEPGVWFLAHADPAAGGRAITFARLVGSDIIPDGERGPVSCAPVGLNTYEREVRGEQRFRYSTCRLWVDQLRGRVGIYPMQIGAAPERVIDVGDDVAQIVADGDHVWISTLSSRTSKYGSALLRLDADGTVEDVDQEQRLADNTLEGIAHSGSREPFRRGDWLWAVLWRPQRPIVLVAFVRPDPPPLPLLYEPTPSASPANP